MKNAASRPPRLRELQRWLAAQVLQPDRPEAEVRNAALVVPPPRGRAAERIGVYAQGYPARVEESLAENFPAVAHVIGPTALTGLVHRYIEQVPLHSYNLNHAGLGFSSFLRGDPLGSRFPFLPDLAALEWQVAQAFHARELAPFDPAPLAAWTTEDWERAVLRFQPSVSVVCSDWPIREIWECRDTPIAQVDIDLRNRGDRVLVRRARFDVVCESLTPDEARIFTALQQLDTLGEVAAALAADRNEPSAVTECFARWAKLGMIVDCSRR